jgi:hypothetical protein
MAKNLRFDNQIPRFETEIEKRMHKVVSSLKYGEKITISTNSMSQDEEKALTKALNKSAKFNCIELKIQKAREKDSINISVNGF